MSSIHFSNSRKLAAEKGAAFGVLPLKEAETFADMSKREMIEIMLRLAALCEGDESAVFDARAYNRVMAEHAALKENGLI